MIAIKKSGVTSPTVRVAIYARKSVADAHDQEFGSIQAQRESCAAYVASQRGHGWTALAESYDDEGFTGANIDRPAFQRLLGDIAAGKIDVIATYKVDRLSRSLLDFTQLLETFRRHKVAFVSVTESFDTSTPMGRMVVSLLATFAQYERETIAGRVRDKVHATRVAACGPVGACRSDSTSSRRSWSSTSRRPSACARSSRCTGNSALSSVPRTS